MSELFDIPESLSPRLAWLKKHSIEVRQYSPDEFDWFAGQDFAWGAKGGGEWGQGDTEDEALTQWALKAGVKLWNEEAQS